MLSDVDTWHHCPVHGAGVPHPCEDELRWEVEAAAQAAGLSVAAFLAQCAEANAATEAARKAAAAVVSDDLPF